MTPETKQILDDLETVAEGLNDMIENVAITGRPCELHSFYVNKNDKTVTEKIISPTLSKLLINGLSAELRGIEGYVTRRAENNPDHKETCDEILARIEQIRKIAF
jgi:hypothetical protein